MGSRIEVIYILPDKDAGVTTIVRNLLRYRPKSEISYTIIFTHEIEDKDSIRVSDKFNVDQQIAFEYSKYDNLFHVFKRLKKYISSSDSIIVANDGLELRLCNFLKLRNPLVYIIHGDYDYYYKIACLNQGVIDKFIAYSQFNLETLKLKLDKESQKKTSLIYYPVPDNKENCNRKSTNFQVLFVGSLIERKGVNLLKPIHEELVRKKINFEFKIIGSGDKEPLLKSEFEGCNNVFFIGQLQQDKVSVYYTEAHVLLLPTHSEGLPNVVVEAMKAGCVPVVSNIPSGIPDIVEDRVNGFLLKKEDVLGFAEAIEELSQNENLFKKLSENSIYKANEMFNPIRQAKIYENEITALINSKNEKTNAQYPLGGILNQKWIPNLLTRAARQLIRNPKL